MSFCSRGGGSKIKNCLECDGNCFETRIVIWSSSSFFLRSKGGGSSFFLRMLWEVQKMELVDKVGTYDPSPCWWHWWTKLELSIPPPPSTSYVGTTAVRGTQSRSELPSSQIFPFSHYDSILVLFSLYSFRKVLRCISVSIFPAQNSPANQFPSQML